MSDLFQDAVPAGYITAVATVMARVNWHTYQVLTKRSTRMREFLTNDVPREALKAHVWWGVSVENRVHGVPRIVDLQNTPAAVRFLSIEPLLEDLGDLDLGGIHWVIVGGESGAGARRMDVSWVERIQRQCAEQNIPFFFKQWGGVNKKRTGRMLNGRTFDDSPSRIPNEPPSAERRAILRRELASFLETEF